MTELMSLKSRDADGRLDDVLSRIAMETQEIQELEQQLTDGQILANELLQKDLEGILDGLPEYLRGLRLKASDLQAENEGHQRHPEDAQSRRRQLDDSARAQRARLTFGDVRPQKTAARQEAPAAPKTEARALKRQKAGPEAELRKSREELNQQFRPRKPGAAASCCYRAMPITQRSSPTSSAARTQEKMVGPQDRPEDRRAGSVATGRTSRGKDASCPSGGAARAHVDPLRHDKNNTKKKPQQGNQQLHRTNRFACERDARARDDLTTVCARVLRVCGEARCVERTLDKRRAELREADRRLTDARARFRTEQVRARTHGPRHKAGSKSAFVFQAASRRSATCLKQIALRLRVLRDEEAELSRRMRAEHQRLREVKAELKDREAESQALCTTIHMATHKLSELTSACQEARACLDWTLTQVALKTTSKDSSSTRKSTKTHKNNTSTAPMCACAC
ncbi:centriolin-like isoform X3 [Phycodurus eques]|uniref:centriolin-like isoform X3 n=1 Tax=Phycodurus eques TaxID=693459 RepID=UPI002ACDC5AB|nr:centriolin-like isoform X3 [Phycodurus eques]